MNKPSLYLETTIPSFLVAKESRDIIQLARQQITREWWNNRLNDFDVYISQVVIDEAGSGDPTAARKRIDVLQPFPLLEITEDVVTLAEKILKAKLIPEKAIRDATHIAIAAYHKTDFLLTWNCKHIANAERVREIGMLCKAEGYEAPIICTPEELSERS
jgi:hypothetical protein